MIFFTVGIGQEETEEHKSAVSLAQEFGVNPKHIKDFDATGSIASSDVNNNTLKKMVFLAHSNQKHFGNHNAHSFVRQFDRQFKQLKGAQKEDIEDIYLIGCEVGLSRDNKEQTIAQIIADELFRAGYINVRVHAIRNRHPASELKVEVKTIQAKEGHRNSNNDHTTVVLTGTETFKGKQQETFKINSRIESGHTAKLTSSFQQALDADEFTFWPTAVKHVVDTRKAMALSYIEKQAAHLKHKVDKNKNDIESREKLAHVQALVRSINLHYIDWQKAQALIQQAADDLIGHGGIRVSSTRKVLLGVANEDYKAVNKIIAKQKSTDASPTVELRSPHSSDGSDDDTDTQSQSASSKTSKTDSEQSDSLRAPLLSSHERDHNRFFTSTPIHDQSAVVTKILADIIKYINILKKEKAAKRCNPFVGYIGNYKLKKFEQLRDDIVRLNNDGNDVDAIYDRIRATSQNKWIGAGFNKPSRAVTLLNNLLEPAEAASKKYR